LAIPYLRLVDDWGDFDRKPPGQHTVFYDLLDTLLRVALVLPPFTRGREALLRRVMDFAETLMHSNDDHVHDLAVHYVAMTLDEFPVGPETAASLGGERLNEWFAAYSNPESNRTVDVDIIDLWGVRPALASALPTVPTTDLAGTSYPADYYDVATLEDAKALADGVVILASYGTSHLLAVIPAAQVRANEESLSDAAIHLALVRGGDTPDGNPAVSFTRIPDGERVWNMTRGSERHAPLDRQLWLHDSLEALRPSFVELIDGDIEQLPY
jgi:hypothetical protein